LQALIRKISLLSLIAFSLLLISCGDDFKESGIEGRWQLQKKQTADGTIVQVDTVFYSFKKNVFEYLKLTSPTEYYHIFGNYSTEGQSVSISIAEDSAEPKDCQVCFDWDTLQRSFLIKDHTSSRLELESGGTVYFFRKY